MIFKKKFLLLTFFLIITFQAFLYTNNNQKTTFRYFKWTVQEISTGKLINIAFFSGLFLSTLLNTSVSSSKKNTVENTDDNNKSLNDEDYMESNIEMPPQRDIRDAQPTISVNYRVVKNIEDNNLKSDQYYSNSSYNKDDWDNEDNEW